MKSLRRSDARGHIDHGWLETRHTFSFGSYLDPDYMGFRALRVINEDVVQPAQGFGTHPHRDMEILTWIVSGSLEHRDSMGNGSIIRPGEMQRMTAGTGVTHSEKNPSADEPVHLLQIWIEPEERGLAPGYEQIAFPAEERRGRLRLVASRDGREGSVRMHRDASIYAAWLAEGEEVVHELREGRYAWLQVVRGAVRAGDLELAPGDGLAVSGEPALRILAPAETEFLLFDLD